jgi:hypothetical protein
MKMVHLLHFGRPPGLIRIRVRVRAHSEFTVTFYGHDHDDCVPRCECLG